MSIKDPTEVIDHVDRGDDTARRYDFQHGYAAILLLRLIRTEDWECIYCEQFEDILIKLSDERGFWGVQVKTRDPEAGPLKSTDEPVVKSVAHFIAIDRRFPGKFQRFVLASNVSFLGKEGATDLEWLTQIARGKVKMPQSRKTSPFETLRKKVDKRLTDEKVQSVTEVELRDVLQRLYIAENVPSIDALPHELENRISSVFPEHDLRESQREAARAALIELTRRASIWSDESSDKHLWAFVEDPKKAREQAIIANKLISKPNVKQTLEKALQLSPIQSDSTAVGFVQTPVNNYLLRSVVESLSETNSKLINEWKSNFRTGKRLEAFKGLSTLKRSKEWEFLETGVKIEALKLLISWTLSLYRDSERAEQLMSEASRLVTSDELIVQHAVLELHRSGPEEALVLLEHATSDTAREFRLSICMLLGRSTQILKELEENPLHTPEAQRVRALAYLKNGEMQKAREIIQRATTDDDRASLQIAEAIIWFYCGLPLSCSSQDDSLFWPASVSLVLVSSDLESQELLSRAANQFKKLARQTDDHEQAKMLEVWEFACRCCVLSEQELAEQAFDSLQQRFPTDLVISLWGLSRGFKRDFDQSLTELNRRIAEKNASVDEITHFVLLKLEQACLSEAEEVLDSAIELFQQQDAIGYWRYWKSHILAKGGHFDRAVECAETIVVEPQRSIALASVARARFESNRDSADATLLLETLKNGYDSTADPRFLMEFCQAQAVYCSDWSAAVEHAEVLASNLPSRDVIEFFAEALFQSQKFGCLLRLLERCSTQFPTGLSEKLRRFKCWSLANSGEMKQAIEVAEGLLSVHPTAENFLLAAETAVKLGDISRVKVNLRKLLFEKDVRSRILLRATQITVGLCSELAARLWHRAVNEGLDGDPEAFGSAWVLGQSLNVDPKLFNRVSEVVMRHAAKGESVGPIFSVTKSELLHHLEAASNRAEQVTLAYERGEVPLHFFASKVGSSLPRLIGAQFSPQVESPLDTFHIIHGGRAAVSDDSGLHQHLKGRPIHLDITSVLILWELSLLQRVIEGLHDVGIPGQLLPYLIGEVGKLRQHNNGRDVEEANSLIGRGQLSVTPRDGVNDINVQLNPSEEESNAISLSELLAEAHRIGMISEHVPSTTVTAETSSTISLIEKSLRLSYPVIQELSSRNLLTPLAGELRLVVDEYVANEVVAACKRNKFWDQQSRELERLIDVLSQSIESNSLSTFTVLSCERNHADSPDMVVTEELLSYESNSPRTVVIDDRFFSSYLRSNQAIIVSTVDILRWLASTSETFDFSKFYEAILKLRSIGAASIPLQDGELQYWLKRACTSQAVRETPALKVLRRDIARTVLRIATDPCSRAISTIENGRWRGEAAYLLNIQSKLQEAIQACWRTNSPAVAIAASEWVLSNFSLSTVGVRQLLYLDEESREDWKLRSLEVAHTLLNLATSIDLDNSSPKGLQHQAPSGYELWLMRHLVEPMLTVDPELEERVAEVVAKQFCSLAKDASDTERLIIAQIARQLPEPFGDEVLLRIAGSVPVETVKGKYVGFGGVRIDAEVFWNAVVEVQDMVEVCIKGTRNLGDFIEVIVSRDSAAYLIKVDGKTHGISFPKLYVDAAFSLSLPELATKLDSERRQLDIGTSELRNILASLDDASSAAERVSLVEEYLDQSLPAFVDKLRVKWLNEKVVNLSDLISPRICLMRYFRMQDCEKVSHLCEEPAQRLLDEHGLAEALNRLIQLPFSLPKNVRIEFERQPTSTRFAILEFLSKNMWAPQAKLHLISLAKGFEWFQLYHLNDLWAERENYRKCFEVLLHWVYFSRELTELNTPAKLALSWGYAGVLYDLFTRLGLDLRRMGEMLSGAIDGPKGFWARMQESVDTRANILHPYNFDVCEVQKQALRLLHNDSMFNDANDLKRHQKTIVNETQSPVDRMGLIRDTNLFVVHEQSLLGAAITSDSQAHEWVENAINELLSAPQSADNWALLVNLVGRAPIYKHLRSDFLYIVSKLNLSALGATTQIAITPLVEFVSEQLCYVPAETKIIERTLLQIRNLGDALVENGVENKSRKLVSLANSVLQLLMTEVESRVVFETIYHLMNLNEDDEVQTGILSTLVSLAQILPSARSIGLWKVILRLRVGLGEPVGARKYSNEGSFAQV